MATVEPEAVHEKLDAVVRAMKASGLWDVARPADKAFVDMGAFGTRSMAFAQWLRWVFVPNVESLISAGGPFPRSSQVSVQAAREGDTDPLIAALCPSLRSFDQLFSGETPTPPAAPPPASPAAEARDPARTALARAEALLAERRFAEAFDEAQRAVAEDASCPNAENFAGWVLMQTPGRTPADAARAAGHFRRAHAQDPYAKPAVANLGDALLAAGSPAEAVAEMSRIAEATRGASADNWLGWYFTQKEPDLERARTHLVRAVARAPGWGVCRLNHAWVLDQRGEWDAAYAEYTAAIDAGDAHDLAFAHARRGFIQEQKGWLKNALRSLRCAKRIEKKNEGNRLAEYTEATTRLDAALRAAGVSPPKERTDDQNRGWARECELELPVELTLGRTESGAPMPAELVEVARKVREGRFDEAVQALREAAKHDLGMLVDGRGIARRGADAARAAGRRREALELMQLVCDGHRINASWATSGAEGLGRMHDVEQARAELARWQRELGY
ncbi:MAG: YqcC family protein [Polyangiaceae bacterium]|nr:YqcC family protein [Polyangiaceae bacterium]